MTNQKEDFVPIREGEVGMYVCGMTVYDNCHLGHARAMMAFDILARYLRYQGYKVNFIRNITDIDDKIIERAYENKDKSIMDVTPKAIDQFFAEHRIDLLIHGHTHRPKTHHTSAGTRIVLGDWYKTGWCLFLDDQQQDLTEFKL